MVTLKEEMKTNRQNPYLKLPQNNKMYTLKINQNGLKHNNFSSSSDSPKPLTSAEYVQGQPGHFTSALVHEVRNPLSSINLAAEMLKSLILDDDKRIYLDIIIRGSWRINDIITSLLTFDQIEEMEPERHSIHQLLNEVLAMTGDRIMLKNIVVSKDFTSLDSEILVNKQKMKIALSNIIINAIEGMPPEKGHLNLVTKFKNGKCIIEIEDNGVGISEKNLKTIFKPYVTNKPGGMGLGLSTSLDILRSNHAGIDVLSEEGKGTRFILSFDRVQ